MWVQWQWHNLPEKLERPIVFRHSRSLAVVECIWHGSMGRPYLWLKRGFHKQLQRNATQTGFHKIVRNATQQIKLLRCLANCVVTYTGWTLSTGFGSESASRCLQWFLNTCRPTANPSPAFLVVATCDRLTVVISTSHVWNLLRTEGVHLHTPALQTGTHFLLILETIVFLFHLLGATSKPFSSLSTRLAHAARLGFFLQKRAI